MTSIESGLSTRSKDPWYLTICRTQGLLFLRPEKSWKPIVSVAVDGQTHECMLGCDGQNPNAKSPIVLRGVSHGTRLDISVWHRSHRNKRTKKHLVGSVYISLGEMVKMQGQSGSKLDLRLSCPPPQKRSPTIGSKRLHEATLTVKLVAPDTLVVLGPPEPVLSSSTSLLADIVSDVPPSSRAPSETLVSHADDSVRTWRDQIEPTIDEAAPNQLRHRRPRKLRPYCIDSDVPEGECTSDEASYPSTPHDDYFPIMSTHSAKGMVVDDLECADPEMLSQQVTSNEDVQLTVFEHFIDVFAPYHEMREARLEDPPDCERYEKVLARLLTEWYVVGASLLAIAAIDAAIFGFAPSPGTLFVIDGLSERLVVLSSLTAGIGIMLDAWFLMLYSSANGTRFQRLSTDFYGTHLFFCLSCRMPSLCMLLSSVCLMGFLLAVAWVAWPEAVYVMSGVAGTLITLQYLVYGFHKAGQVCFWIVRGFCRAIRGRRDSNVPRPNVARPAGDIPTRPAT
ncbi:hypothetical protein OBBRIDRAFT_628773 [Obba rivulosa]|uniref:Uncharacterized protein n=1 Tax=Obba rivulosa TaxID=1052685 RepID=A0A8E2DJ54_9APHY|nr:hypothetical protein OBBRIDRAFT_628773 [Obba rivulosa]